MIKICFVQDEIQKTIFITGLFISCLTKLEQRNQTKAVASPCGKVANVLDCGIEVNEFEFQ